MSTSTPADDDTRPSTEPSPVNSSIADLIARGRALEDEIRTLARHAASHFPAPSLSTLSVRADALAAEVRTETTVLERILSNTTTSSSPSATAATTAAASSNIPFQAAVWDAAKRLHDIYAVRHRVSSSKPRTAPNSVKAKRKSWNHAEILLAPGTRVISGVGQCHKDPQLMIDIVADSGLTWWKVSTVHNRRLLYDLAKEGLYLGAGEEGGLEEALEEVEALDDDAEYGDVPLVKLAREYMHAARAHRIRGRPPEMHLVLPRVDENAQAEISLLVAACRRMGAHVHTASQLAPAPALTPAVLDAMAPSPLAAFTDVLNLDTSILIALSSDFCHARVEIQPWFSRSHHAHYEKEQQRQMMPEVLPALQGHDLVCTAEAIETFQHIMATIGTETECARASLLLETPETASLTSDDRVAALQKLSIHPIPPTLRLPIRPAVLTADLKARVPLAARDVLARNPDMLQPGLDVFQYGWATGRTTVTANHVATRTLGRDLELDGRLVDDADWPSVWVSSTSRPLVGVPKFKRTRKHVAECAGAAGCVCGIERFHGGRTYDDDEGEGEGKNGEEVDEIAEGIARADTDIS